MKITSVEPQKKNLHRFNIFLDGEFAFGADEDLVVSRRLVVGKEIKKEELDEILKEVVIGKIMEKMYRLFSIRQRSEKEIREYFRIKNYELTLRLRSGQGIKGNEVYSDFVIETAINKLKLKELINDEEFAKAWIDARSKKYGINRIKQELFQKGIDRETIKKVISHQSSLDFARDRSDIRQEQTISKLMKKKSRIWKNLNPQEFRKKASEYLLRRGFEYEDIKEVVEKYLKEL